MNRRCVLWFAGWLLLGGVASPSHAELWEFSCTEAVALLKNAQSRVVKNHDLLQEARFSLRHRSASFDGCSSQRRGFHGAEIHCVRHQSLQRQGLREVFVAQRRLESATAAFMNQLETVLQQCPVSETGPLP